MNLRRTLVDNSDLVLAVGVVGILLVLFTPIPSQLLDLLLITNFAFALLILLITFYAAKPVEFSTDKADPDRLHRWLESLDPEDLGKYKM